MEATLANLFLRLAVRTQLNVTIIVFLNLRRRFLLRCRLFPRNNWLLTYSTSRRPGSTVFLGLKLCRKLGILVLFALSLLRRRGNVRIRRGESANKTRMPSLRQSFK